MAKKLEKAWPNRYSPAVRERISHDLRMIVDHARDQWSPQSIILSGSFGTGEGSILEEDSGLRYLSDYEISIVRWRPISRDALKTAGKVLAEKVGTEIGFYYNPPFKYRSRFLQRLFWRPSQLPVNFYDRRYASCILYGADCLAELPELDATDIPVWEGLRLIFNRLGQSLGAIGADNLSASAPNPDAEHGAFWLYRIVSACQDALLIASGRYAASYTERTARLGDQYPIHYPELKRKLPDFVALAQEATNYRLHPRVSTNISFMNVFARVQEACRIIVLHLLSQELGIHEERGEPLHSAYIAQPRVRRLFYRRPTRWGQDMHNARAVAAQSGSRMSWTHFRKRRMLHQHLNITIFLLFINMRSTNDHSLQQLQIVRRLARDFLFVDLPEVEEASFIPSAVSSLDKLWASFRM